MSDVLKNLSNAMADTVASLSPSLVTIEGRRRLGSTGIVWSADGIIVTAHHTVERDDEIAIIAHDGTRHTATLIGRDPANDLAVLRVPASLTPATWADDNSLRVGNLVLALGKPGDQTQATLGVVSALVSGAGRSGGGRRRRRGMGQALIDGFVQTDVVMYPGFSGGPLVSGDGAIHGLNTSGFSRGVSVTVPVATIRRTIATLLEHGKIRQGYLGIGLQPVRLPEASAKSLDQETGLLIVSVEADSPANTTGLIVGDIVVSLAGEAVTQLEELLGLLYGERVGQSVEISILRGGEQKTLNITIGER